VPALPGAQRFGGESAELGGGLDREHADDCTGFVQLPVVQTANGGAGRLAPHPVPEFPMKPSATRLPSRVRPLILALSLGLAAPLAMAGQSGADRAPAAAQ